jgi:hypothetical protein
MFISATSAITRISPVILAPLFDKVPLFADVDPPVPPPEYHRDRFEFRPPICIHPGPWKLIPVRAFRCDSMASAGGTLPGVETDLSKTAAFRHVVFGEEWSSCSECNVRGCDYLYRERNPRGAYVQFKKGMSGTGDHEYVRLPTKHFEERLDDLCACDHVENYVNEFQLSIIL